MPKLNLLDVVALLEDIPSLGLTRGQVGTIVEVLGDNMFEVEFSGNDGVCYALASVPETALIGLRMEQSKAS